jgi:hypothetical protein
VAGNWGDGSRILIFQQRGWGVRIGHHLARRFQEDGCAVGALVFKKSTERFVRDQREVTYRWVGNYSSLLDDPAAHRGPSPPSLDEVCAGLGVCSVWPLVQSMRILVKSYRDRYGYGFKQHASDEQIATMLQAIYLLLRRALDEFQPHIIISPNFVALPHLMMGLMARQRGIPMFGVTDSKVRGLSVFVHDHLDRTGPFIERIEALNAGEVSPSAERAEAYIATNRQRLVQPEAMEAFVAHRPSAYRQLRLLARELRASLRNEDAILSLGITEDGRTPRYVLRDFMAHRVNARAARAFPYHRLEEAGAYAFFPLQYQPEESLDVHAVRFNNQLETARQVAMSLPGDMTLVVKDHPAMEGRRPRSYLEKLSRTPNVKLVDHRIPSERLLRGARLLVGASGTAFAEAAMLGLAAIQLGDLGTIRLLPNVTHHADVTTLEGRISEVLAMPPGGEDYERRLRNYVAAAYDVGFNDDYYALWERGGAASREPIYQRFSQHARALLEAGA